MKYYEILEKIKSGDIKIDLFGHKTHCDPKEKLVRFYSQEKKIMETCDELKEHLDKIFNHNYKIGDSLFNLPEIHCLRCGYDFYFIFDGNKISLRRYHDEFKMHITTKRCELEYVKPMTTEIITAGCLVFTNYFICEDCPKEEEHTPEYNLNGLRGRRNIASYKAKYQNIAYGQMGDMAIGVFINSNKDSIIIGNPYISDVRTEYLSDEEYDNLTDKDWKELRKIEEHEYLDKIFLDVWRWEAGDKKALGPLLDEVKEREYRNEVIEINCKPGIWQITHYYDMLGDNQEIYSRLEFKKGE
ncbi:MAG: hypothetical protein ACOCUI_00730 [bacterium]